MQYRVTTSYGFVRAGEQDPFRLTEETEFLGDDLEQIAFYIAAAYVKALVSFENNESSGACQMMLFTHTYDLNDDDAQRARDLIDKELGEFGYTLDRQVVI